MEPKANSAEYARSPIHRHVVPAADREQQTLEQIRKALAGLTFGSINLVVQDGVVVQIERNEKFRPARSADSKGPPHFRRQA
jgi:hypothetical protein